MLKLSISTSVLAIAAAVASPACAQGATQPAAATETPATAPATTPATQPDTGLGDIIVTATKRSESVNRVPMSITAATGAQLGSAGIMDVAGLAKLVPGFSAVDSSYGTPVYYLRGVGFFETTLMAKPTVGVYMNEVPLPYSAMTQGASFDLERVEVLKGPQGTLFGSNATGGAINYIAAAPTRTFTGGVDGSLGRFAESSLGGFISGPLSDTLSARLAVQQQFRGDWQRSTTRNDELGKRDFLQGRFQLAWKPSSALRFNFMVNAFRDRSDTQAAQFVTSFRQTTTTVLDPALATYPTATDNARQADWGSTYPLKRDNKMIQVSLRADYDVSPDITLTSLSAYTHYKHAQGQDSDATSLQLADLFITGKIDSFFQELRAAAKVGSGGQLLIGGNYEHSKGPERDDQRLINSSSARAFLRFGFPLLEYVPQISETTYESKAIFANIDYDLGPQLTVHAGARYTETQTDFTGCVLNAGSGSRGLGLGLIFRLTPPPLDTCSTLVRVNGVTKFGAFSGKLPEHNVSWRGGLDYKINATNLLYANVSRGFKSGSFSNLPGNDESQYYPVKQEQLTAYEVGFKSSFANRTVQLNGALFHYDYVNKQLKGRTNVPVFNFLEALVNIPKSWIRGGEVQVTWLPVSGLRLSGGASYIDTRITKDFSNFTAFGQVINFKGYGFSNTPHWQANADAEYRWTMGGGLKPYVGASANYRGATNGDFKPDARLAIKAYTLIDLRAGIEGNDGAWRVGVYGRNITDKYYWTTATRRNDAVIRFAGMPATYGVNFSVRF